MSARIPLRSLARATFVPTPTTVAPRLAAARWASTQAASSSDAEASSSKPATATPTPTDKAAPAKNAGGKGKAPVDPYEVPPLSRPLGVPVMPVAAAKTKEERLAELMNKDRRKAERKALVREATQGYFHDYHLARKANGGKLWVAPPVLIREDRALYFPDITGKALTGNQVHTTDLLKGKVSLVTILNTRVSEEHVQSFVEPVLEDWGSSQHFNYIQINHQENPLKSMLLSFFVSSLKRTIPEDRWGSYMISSGEWSEFDITGPLGIENKMLGYVFLVDENVKVRWAGCAQARPKERDDLRRATAVLVRRKLPDAQVEPVVEA